MEVHEIIASVIIIALLLYFAFFYIQSINIEAKKEESATLFFNRMSDAKISLWSEGCINSPLYTIRPDELLYLGNYNCSIPPCLAKNPYPIFVEVNISGFIIEFGICPLDKSKCNINSFKLVISNSYIANASLYYCLDDLSVLTALLQYNCNYNLSFKFDFSTKINNLRITNDTVCINNICNHIFCKKFPNDFSLNDAKSIYVSYENGGYNVIKIS